MRVILRSASPRQLAMFSLVFADSVLGLADRRAHAPKYFVLCVFGCVVEAKSQRADCPLASADA